MQSEFHLLDLRSQALAVQRLLKGRAPDEKLAWLGARGELSRVAVHVAIAPPTYHFVSTVGLDCFFFIDGDEFVFLWDHTTYTAKEEIKPE
jgi:hypothetical protein